jgi:hypothetical protein
VAGGGGCMWGGELKARTNEAESVAMPVAKSYTPHTQKDKRPFGLGGEGGQGQHYCESARG